MNVLLLSVGTRNKIVQYFKKELNSSGKVIATDMSILAPAIYEADKYYIVPCISDKDYLKSIIDICKKEKIDAVLSLIDPELSLLARNTILFKNIGVTVIESSYDLCEMALDKYKMFIWLRNHQYNCAKSYINKEEFIEDLKKGLINFPVFVKPCKGSASINISKVDNLNTINALFENCDDLIIQEYLDGQEIGADVYIDLISKKVISIFTKKKLKMRAGETDKAVSFKDGKLFDLIEKFCYETGYIGQIDIDVFKIEDKYYISEVNPRFGGGYPHAHESGCNHIKYIINNINGLINESNIGAYDDNIYMMKYNEVMIKSSD